MTPVTGAPSATTGPTTIDTNKITPYQGLFDPTSYLNYIRDPQQPFLANSSLQLYNYASFTDNGFGVTWVPFDMPGTDYHRVATMTDPLTGLSRLIFGNDQGVWSALDNNGTFETQIGSSDSLAGVDRNGNLQITQFYYGAAQPSTAAAQIAQALFYGSAQDNGGPFSDPNLINDGDIVWGGGGGDAAGVATDQQGNGTVYQYFWPCCGGNDTDFFQVNGVGAPTWGFLFTTILTLTTGTIFVMWLGEQITERGIGNGISLLIFAGIVIGLPRGVEQIWGRVRGGDTISARWPLPTGATMSMTRAERSFLVGSSYSIFSHSSG